MPAPWSEKRNKKNMLREHSGRILPSLVHAAPKPAALVKLTFEHEGQLLGSEAQRVEDVPVFTVRHDRCRAEQRSSRAASGVEVAIVTCAELCNDLHRLLIPHDEPDLSRRAAQKEFGSVSSCRHTTVPERRAACKALPPPSSAPPAPSPSPSPFLFSSSLSKRVWRTRKARAPAAKERCSLSASPTAGHRTARSSCTPIPRRLLFPWDDVLLHHFVRTVCGEACRPVPSRSLMFGPWAESSLPPPSSGANAFVLHGTTAAV